MDVTTREVERLLGLCDASLVNKPCLSAIFDNKWRRDFRKRTLACAENERTYPWAYYLPVLYEACKYPPAAWQSRVEHGLSVLWPQMTEGDRRQMSKRLREADPSSSMELYTASAFATAFGDSAVVWPEGLKKQRKPEFFVKYGTSKFAVECRNLMENVAAQSLNEAMLRRDATSWGPCPHDPDHEARRLQSAIVEKINHVRGGEPTALIIVSLTPSLLPSEMEGVVRSILLTPSAHELAETQLPIVLVCTTLTVLQGIWLSEAQCNTYGIDAQTQERIRQAITDGYVRRNDDTLMTEADWETT